MTEKLFLKLVDWAPFRIILAMFLTFCVLFFYKFPNNVLEWVYRKRTGAKHSFAFEYLRIYKIGPWKKFLHEIIKGKVS